MVDCYDSFTYNLCQLLAVVNGIPPKVVTNDCGWELVESYLPHIDCIVLSPGPGQRCRFRPLVDVMLYRSPKQ